MICYFCNLADKTVKLYNIQFVPNSVEVIRPVCDACMDFYSKDFGYNLQNVS
jgi:hypothetical protein